MNELKPDSNACASNLFVVMEDHYLREKVAGVLSRLPGTLMVSQTDECAKAARAAACCCPDAVFICLRQAVSQADSLRRLRAACACARFFAVADCPDCAALASADDLGVDAVLTLTTMMSDLEKVEFCRGCAVTPAARTD